MNLNHLVLSGHLTRDPDLRTIATDKVVAHFSVAHNTRYKSAEGELRSDVTFVDCEAWGRQGELVAQYLQKGALVVLEGALRTDNWTDKEGNKRSRLKLRVDRVHFTPRGRNDEDMPSSDEAGEATAVDAPAALPVATTRPARSAAPRPVTAGAGSDDPPF